jgi:hypothetical protein
MRSLSTLSLLLALTLGPRAAIGAIPQENPKTAVTIVTNDASGAPLKDELVIVQNLDDREREIVRVLSDANGQIPVLGLEPGLYRVIATSPYGLWQTLVREFLVNDKPVRLVLGIEGMATHGNGDVVTVGTKRMFVRVLDSDGHPAVGAAILARDRDDTLYLERWYKTDQSGGATVEVVSDPLVLVVILGKTLVTREIPLKSLQQIIQLPRP